MELNQKRGQDLSNRCNLSATEADKVHLLDHIIRMEQNNILPARYFYIILDYVRSELLYSSPKMEKKYGKSLDKLRQWHKHLLFDTVSKKEKRAILNYLKITWEDHFPRGRAYLSGRVFTVEYSVKSLKGDTLRIMHQNEVLTFTGQGLPKMGVSRFVDLSWLFGVQKKRTVKMYVYNRQTNKIEHYAEKKISENPMIRLTPREAEIKSLIDRGYTSLEIAKRLHISSETVKTHRKNINAKRLVCHARSR